MYIFGKMKILSLKQLESALSLFNLKNSGGTALR